MLKTKNKVHEFNRDGSTDGSFSGSVTHSLSNAEFLELQDTQLQSILKGLLLQPHGTCVSAQVLHRRRGAVWAWTTQEISLHKSTHIYRAYFASSK